MCIRAEEELPPNTCPMCGGTGAVTAPDDSGGTYRAMCPRCNGFGAA